MEKDVDETAEQEAENIAEDAAADTETEKNAEEADEKTDAEPAGETKKKGKRKKDKNEALIEELTDRVKRQMAEFDNFRKRSEKEKAGMFDLGAKNVIEQLLPVVDNFERGLAGVSEEQMADPFVDGMNKIYKQMTELLEKLGVKPIEAVGNEFNPDFHNAVMHVDDEEAGDNGVVEEFLKGYTYKDQVVRHSMVKVAN